VVGRRPRLAGQPCPAPVARAIVDDCLTLIDTLDPIVARLQRDLRARAKLDLRVTALQVLPGVGQITAMTLVAEIGDVTGFATAASCAPGRG
jgi:transposase